MNSEQQDECNDKLQHMTLMELRQLIQDRITNYLDKGQLIDYIEENFDRNDWEWFFEEHVMEGGVQDV